MYMPSFSVFLAYWVHVINVISIRIMERNTLCRAFASFFSFLFIVIGIFIWIRRGCCLLFLLLLLLQHKTATVLELNLCGSYKIANTYARETNIQWTLGSVKSHYSDFFLGNGYQTDPWRVTQMDSNANKHEHFLSAASKVSTVHWNARSARLFWLGSKQQNNKPISKSISVRLISLLVYLYI